MRSELPAKLPLALFALWLGLLPQASGEGLDLGFKGNYSSSVILDESGHDPTQTQTYPWLSRTFGSSPSVWANQFSLFLEGSSPRGELSFNFPLRLNFSLTALPGQTAQTYRLVNSRNGWDAARFRLKGGNYQVEFAQSSLFRRGGLLGNFRAPVISAGTWTDDLGLRISGKAAGGWEYFGNVFRLGQEEWRKNENIFTHYVESLPEGAAALKTGSDGAGDRVDSFQGGLENRAYYAYGGAEGRGLLQAQDSWGIYYGGKMVDNPLLMKDNNDAAGSRLRLYNGKAATLGYTKQALEFNWQGKAGAGKLAAAGSVSRADWRANLTEEGRAESLGAIGGGAAMLDLEGFKMGPVTVAGSWRTVSPDYQWVMVRDPAQIYAPLGRGRDRKVTKGSYLANWSALNTISEVGRYFGMRSADLSASVEGTILEYPSRLTGRIVNNRWLDPLHRTEYWDRDLDLLGNEDYKQAQMDLQLLPDSGNTIFARMLLRQYLGIGKNYLAQYKAAWQRKLERSLVFTVSSERRERLLANAGRNYGASYLWEAGLEGDVAPRTKGKFSVRGLRGNYDFLGLLTQRGYERLNPEDFGFWQVRANLERRLKVQLFNLKNVDLTCLGQAWTQWSDLAGVTDGTSLVGALRLGIPWLGGALRHNLDLVVAAGPDDPQLPTGYVISALDNKLTYRFTSNTNNTFTLRCTSFPADSGLAALTVFNAQYRIDAGDGWFVINYGYWDNPLDNSGRNAPWLTQDAINTKRNPLTEEAFDYSNYWWVSRKENHRMANYSNYFLLNYGLNF